MNNIELNSTHLIYDSTKVQEYMECPRKYFYKYVLGWNLDIPNVHLKFGEAWHLSMEYLLLHGRDPVSIIEAYRLFEERYREYFPSEMSDPDRAPKIPATVFKALPMYAAFSSSMGDGEKEDVLYTEVSGTVAVKSNRMMHFKMDSIIRDKEKEQVLSREHKTASAMSRQNKDKWKIALQTGTYNHVLYCMYKPEEVYGVEINLAVFTKGKIAEFVRIPSRRNVDMMEVWLWQVNEYIDCIERDMNILNSAKEDDVVMKCFKRNEQSCTSYTGCEYFDFCTSWSNPLRNIDNRPESFIERFWDPREIRDVKHTFAL